MWSEYYNSGRWTIVRGGEQRSLTGTLYDFAIVSVRQCRMMAAFVRRAGQLTGASKIKVDHPQCRARGSPACVFTAAW